MASEPRFTVPGIVTGGVLADVLRLEVEKDPAGLVNLVKNPDGSLGGYGWVSPVATTVVRTATANGPALEFTTPTGPAGAACWHTSEALPVTAGQYVAAQWEDRGAGPTGGPTGTGFYYRVRFEWFNASGALISSSTQTALFINTSGTVRTYAAVQAPAGTTRARLRFDLYGNTGGAGPILNQWYRFTAVSVARASTAAALSSTITNLIPNPSFETALTGWAGDAGATLARTTGSALVGTYKLEATHPGGLSTASAVGPRVNVSPGTDYTGTVHVRAPSGATRYAIAVRWFDATDAYMSATGPGTDTVGTTYKRATTTQTAPPGAAYARLAVSIVRLFTSDGSALWVDGAAMVANAPGGLEYFDGDTAATVSASYAWTGTAHASTSVRTSAGVGNLPPVEYVNVLAPTHAVKVVRGALDVGTLTAEILDANLDPATAAQLRPGRAVRLRALTSAGTWRTLYTATATAARVVYDELSEVPDSKRARITITAVDAIATLAAAERPQSVASIAELPYVLEGCGVPWDVNGSGAQVAAATVRATSSNTTAVDQVAITRDTARGYAWVDQLGVLNAYDAASMPATTVATLNEDTYLAPDVSFDTDACINEVVVKLRSTDATGQTVETVETFTDASSIATWGRYRREFTILAPTSAATFAAAVLAANATPVVRINRARINVRDETFLGVAALDLYDRVQLVHTAKGINAPARVTELVHTITPEAWLLEVGFAGTGSVAAPQVVPPLTDASATPVALEAQVFGTNYAVGSTTPGNVGNPITFQSPGPGAVFLISFTVVVNTTGSGGLVNFISFHVDGAAWNSDVIRAHAPIGQYSTNTRTARLTGLAAGSHTVGVRSWNNAAGSVTHLGPDSTLTVVRIV